MSKHHKTAADYAVIAVCPALIILMLTALVHFLVLCLYRGNYPGRLMYILFLFIFATTLIARIAIEQGRAYAFGYAAALGGATFLVISQFVVLSGPLAGLSWLFNLLLLALIWWLADRITFDCTVIDDAARASGEGLVSSSGLFGGIGSLGAQRSRTAAAALALDGTTTSDDDGQSRNEGRDENRSPRRAGEPGEPGEATAAGEDSRALPRKKRGHQPGRWVLYLALAALPTFGLGQLFLPDFDAVQTGALRSLGLYLFATLMLLVTTSFLGLRRYLRQRGTEMPADVSVAWLGGGAFLVAAILVLCFALPLPGRIVASLDVPNWIASPDWLEPSRFGWGDEGAGPSQQAPATATEGDEAGGESSGEKASGEKASGEKSAGGQSGGEQSGGEQSGGEQSGGEQSGGEQSGGEQSGGEKSGGEKSGGEKSGGEKSGGEKSGGEKSGGEQSGGEKSGGEQSGGEQSGGEQSGGEQSGGEQSGGEQSGGEQSGGEQSGGEQSGGEQSGSSESSQPSSPPPPSTPSSLPQLGSWLSTLLKVGIVAVLLGVILVFALQHRDLIRQWWESVLRFFRGERPGDELAEAEKTGAATKAFRSFASFRNPLSDGSDPAAAIIVSFQALEAWGRERGEPRAEGETPSEYVQRARRLFGDAAPAGERLVEAYNRVVYGRGKPTRRDLAAAEQTWQVMTAAAGPILRE